MFYSQTHAHQSIVEKLSQSRNFCRSILDIFFVQDGPVHQSRDTNPGLSRKRKYYPYAMLSSQDSLKKRFNYILAVVL